MTTSSRQVSKQVLPTNSSIIFHSFQMSVGVKSFAIAVRPKPRWKPLTCRFITFAAYCSFVTRCCHPLIYRKGHGHPVLQRVFVIQLSRGAYPRERDCLPGYIVDHLVCECERVCVLVIDALSYPGTGGLSTETVNTRAVVFVAVLYLYIIVDLNEERKRAW